MIPPAQTTREVVYSAERDSRHHLRLIGDMRRNLGPALHPAFQLLRRDLRGRYRQSAFGVALAFAPAIAIAIWATLASQARLINVGSLQVAYPAYVLFSVTLWQAFAEAMSLQIEGLAAEQSTLSKLEVPPESVILARLGEVGFNFALKLLLVVAVFLWYDVAVYRTLALAPFAVLALMLLGTGLGLILAPLNALYQDVSRGLPAVLTLWFFLTPVVFPVPERGLLKTLVALNPVTPLLRTARDLVTSGQVADLFVPLLVASSALVLVLVGWFFYRLALPFVLERTQG